MSRYLLRTSLLVLLAGLVGCGSSNNLNTQLVEGVVTLDGQTVDGATVEFIPAENGEGLAASGFTDNAGKFNLTVLNPPEENQVEVGSGTTPGQYQVTVRKAIVAPTPESSSRQTMGKKTYVVPQKYETVRTSGLTATVTEGSNNIQLDLQSK
ncbi:hypothetical protein AB1L30_23730 [Bremerella sp. JC817]|uniref:hypothetical protein n=1 Tax=Bremerella sp. JC817 TaxID=3231756 RepID=UPI003457A69B